MTRNLSVLSRVSSLAIAAALTTAAAAQSFLGTPTVASGDVVISEGVGTTDVSLNSVQSVIDWMPDDNADCACGAIAFQNSGTTATFSGSSDFAVLNRINVTNNSRWVLLDGTINSLINETTGGNIFFYSPSGFIIGANAVINVGSLVLSASPIAVDGNGNFINGTSVTFNQAPNSGALINTVAGSQINANGSGSYVALVAPVVTHHGTIRTDTAAALVAAEAATINFSPDGLFDIQVTVGTDDPNGVHVEGGTITRNSATEGVNNHYAYLVAVAKNDAVTMLVNSGGSVGFDTATSATVEDNVVVLSGGSDILGGGIWTTSGVSSVNLNIDNAAFSTDVVADVSGTANINSASGATAFGGFLSLNSGGNTLIEALNGNSLDIAGDLFASAFSNLGGGGSAGQQVEVRAQGGSTLTIGGDATLNADSFGADAADDGLNGANATGGNVIVRATNSGTITIAGSLDMSADGFGGDNFFSNGAGGNGTGGLAYIQASGGGTVNVTGVTSVSAEGFGGSSGECSVCLITGGTGTGGQALVSAAGLAGNSISFGSDLNLSAAGFGGAGDVAGGSGLGGIADLSAGDGATVTVAADTEVDASGFGGYGFDATGGAGLGGQARIFVSGGASLDFVGDLSVHGMGSGGGALGGTGGDGTGNIATIGAVGGDIAVGGNAFVDASGFGGAGVNGGSGAGGGNFFTQTGGAHIFAMNGDIVIGGSAVVVSDGFGSDGSLGGGGGDGTGGWATIHAGNSDAGPSTITIEGADAAAFVSASGFGGNGGDGLAGIDGEPGGTGTNGGPGGDGGDGGAGMGGVAAVTAGAGNGTLNIAVTFADANGTGGAGGAGGNGGIGGNGDGGAGGNGGAGGIGGSGGAAAGGLATVGVESGNAQAAGSNLGTANLGSVEFDASAQGGTGGAGGLGGAAGSGSPNGTAGADGNGGDGGSAGGGTAILLVEGGTANVGSANLIAHAIGGDGGTGAIAGIGGDAESDEARVNVTNRLGDIALRGTLNAGAITGTIVSTGGSGSVAGVGMMEGGSGFIVENGDATIDSFNFNIVADAQIPDLAADSIAIVNGEVLINGGFSFATSGVASLYADNSTLTAGTFGISASNFVHDPARTFPASVGTISADTFNLVTGQDLIIDAHLISTGPLSLTAPGLVDVEDATSGFDLTLDAGSTIDGGSMTAAGLVTADAPGDINLNLVIAGTDIDIQSTAGSIATNAQSAGGSILLDGATGITTGDLTAGSDVLLDSGASMSVGNVLAQTGSVQASVVDALSFLSITAGTFVTIDPTAIIGGDITALAGDVTATGDSIDVGNVSASDNVILTATAGDLSTLNIDAGIDVTLDATGAIGTGDITAFGTVDANGGSLDLGNIGANILSLVSTLGDISTGDLVAFSSLTVDSADDFLFGSIIAPLVDLNAPGSIIGGFIDSETDITAVAGADIDVGDLTAGGFDGEVFVLGDIFLTAGGEISTGAIDAFGFVQLLAGADVATGNILADSYIDIFSSGGGIATGDLTGTEVDLEADGDISFGDVDADSFDFDATGAVTGGDIVAFSQVGGDAVGAIILGDITVGPGVPQVDDFSVGIASETSITVGDVMGTDRVGFATFGDLVTGDLSASDLVMALVGGDISTGSITTQPDGTVYMGHASMFIDAGGGEDNFDASLVLALDPVPTGGSITINGDVSTGTFRAAAGSNLTTGAIDAGLIQALAGGLASINGIWSAPFIELWSDDIEIGSNGGMDGGSDGLIRLVSTNATQALIGDGLTGTGYALSDAEFDRLSAGNVQIVARGDASAAIDMLIGDLSVTGPSAGSTIEDPFGALVFATGDPETQVAGGVIRIVGDLTATGFGSDNAIEFYTGRFELDAATGLLEITSNGTDLSGELYIEADRIHVASGAILDQLAVDPHYAGYQDDLNAPAAVQRPEGVIRAGGIDIFPTEAVLVQNTGTAETPAGFLTFGEGPLFSESEAPTGPIELIINGQLITEGGTLTGIDVRDFLIDDANIAIFTDNSTINGCPLIGACEVEPPVPPGFTPTPGIQQEIVLINDNLLPPPEFGNEDFIDDNDEETEEGATSPIEPPDPLFDTSELGEEAGAGGPEVGTSMRANPGLTEPGDVDDPVSGSGNPGLMETVPPPTKEEKQP
jgi:filamentous hemagglutinin family protein